MLSLPDKFVAFTEDSLDRGFGTLLECVRVQYNYQNIYRLLPVTRDDYHHEYPARVNGRFLNTHREMFEYFRQQESTFLAQVSGSPNQRMDVAEVSFYVTPFEVFIEDGDITYDDYDRQRWRTHRNREDCYFRVVILYSSTGNLLFSRQQTQTLVHLDTNEPHFRDCEQILQDIMHNRRIRYPSRHSNTDTHDHAHIPRNIIHPFLDIPRRRAGLLSATPRPPRRVHRGAGLGAGAGAGDIVRHRPSPEGGEPEHPQGSNREIRVVLQRPPLPSERVCIALARDYIAQGETCPILQEPLSWGSIAVTACHCVFTGDSLAVWATNHTTCPSCRQNLQYRTITVEKPADPSGDANAEPKGEAEQSANPTEQVQVDT